MAVTSPEQVLAAPRPSQRGRGAALVVEPFDVLPDGRDVVLRQGAPWVLTPASAEQRALGALWPPDDLGDDYAPDAPRLVPYAARPILTGPARVMLDRRRRWHLRRCRDLDLTTAGRMLLLDLTLSADDSGEVALPDAATLGRLYDTTGSTVRQTLAGLVTGGLVAVVAPQQVEVTGWPGFGPSPQPAPVVPTPRRAATRPVARRALDPEQVRARAAAAIAAMRAALPPLDDPEVPEPQPVPVRPVRRPSWHQPTGWAITPARPMIRRA